jgi:Ndr family
MRERVSVCVCNVSFRLLTHHTSSLCSRYSHKTSIELELAKVRCQTLLFVGEYSYYDDDTVNVFSKLRPEFTELVQLKSDAHLLTDEAPHRMSQPLGLFMAGLGLNSKQPIGKDPVGEMLASLEGEEEEEEEEAESQHHTDGVDSTGERTGEEHAGGLGVGLQK